jgi:hypothetical protein
MTMQLFVRNHFTMIETPVQCDVDGIPKEHSIATIALPAQAHERWAPSRPRARRVGRLFIRLKTITFLYFDNNSFALLLNYYPFHNRLH